MYTFIRLFIQHIYHMVSLPLLSPPLVCCLGGRGGVRLQPGGRDQFPDRLQLLPASVQLQEHGGGSHGAGGNARCLVSTLPYR